MDKTKFIHKVVDIVLRINGGPVSRVGKGHPTAFVDYSGHVNMIRVTVYDTGWVSGQRASRDFTFYLDSELLSDENLEKELNKKIAVLRAYAFALKYPRGGIRYVAG